MKSAGGTMPCCVSASARRRGYYLVAVSKMAFRRSNSGVGASNTAVFNRPVIAALPQ